MKIYVHHYLEQQQHYNYILFKLTLSLVLVALHNEGKCVYDEDSNGVFLESVSSYIILIPTFLLTKIQYFGIRK